MSCRVPAAVGAAPPRVPAMLLARGLGARGWVASNLFFFPFPSSCFEKGLLPESRLSFSWGIEACRSTQVALSSPCPVLAGLGLRQRQPPSAKLCTSKHLGFEASFQSSLSAFQNKPVSQTKRGSQPAFGVPLCRVCHSFK